MRLRVLLATLAISFGAYGQGAVERNLYQQALEAENAGKGAEAARIYVRAARAGDARAARRLGEIYDKGIDGVPRNYEESLKWRNAARVLDDRLIGDFPNPRPR